MPYDQPSMSVRHVQGRALDTALHPVVGALVQCALDVDEAVAAGAQLNPPTLTALTDASGFYAFDIAANADFLPTGTAYVIRILKGQTESEFEIVVTNDPYPPAHPTYLDVADLVVAVPPVPGPMIRGPQGPPGTPGSGGIFTWFQSMPLAVWAIVHNLGHIPASIRSVDSAGSEMEGDWADIDVNHGTLTFGAAFSGVAYLL